MVKKNAILLTALLVASLLLPAMADDYCPADHYPDPMASNCRLGVPYSLSISHAYAGTGKMTFTITVTNVAESAIVGVTSTSGMLVPKLFYSDGRPVQLGDWIKEGTTASESSPNCGIYAVYPGKSVSFTTAVSFKANQDGSEMKALVDNMNWETLPRYPTECITSAHGLDPKSASDPFTYSYNPTAVPATCGGAGASCANNLCCANLECRAGTCIALSTTIPTTTTAPASQPSGGQASSAPAGISAAIIVVLAVAGIAAYLVLSKKEQPKSAKPRKHQKP